MSRRLRWLVIGGLGFGLALAWHAAGRRSTGLQADPGAVQPAVVRPSVTPDTFLPMAQAESPTGHRPKAIWTPRRQALWNALIANGDPEWANLLRSAAVSGTKAQRYADLGQWAAVAYQVTGDPSYAEKAWARIQGKVDKRPNNRNVTREHFLEYAWMYDWLKPALSDEQRRAYIAMMNTWCRLALGQVPGVSWGTRTSDSDETVGHYFGLALWAAVSGDENPQARAFLNDPLVGGYDATGADRKTWRNTISQYVKNARGGVWIESSKYNLGTLRLVLFGAEAIRTATGRDHYPEITALTNEIAAAQLHELTSDLRQSFQWGDEESPRSLVLDRRVPLLAMLSGLATDEGAAGRALALMSALPRSELPPKETVLYNPSRPARDWHDQPTLYVARGMGIAYARDGWQPSASFFGAYLPTRLGVDHEMRYFGNFQFYRGGEWAVTNPLGYDANEGEHINGMLLAGFSSAREARGLLDAGTTTDGTCYVIGATGGHPYSNGYLSPPPYCLHEWSRALVYVPSRDGSLDIVVVHDRTLVQNPKTLRGYDHYRPADQTRMKRELARGLKQWIIHAPVEPLVQGRTIAWRTAGGQSVTVTTLLPSEVTYQVLDERTQVNLGSYVRNSEKHWQIRVIPAVEREWDTFLHVIQMGEQPARIALVRDGDKEGVRIVRAGSPDKIILFNAKPSARLPGVQAPLGVLVSRKGLLDRYRGLESVDIK